MYEGEWKEDMAYGYGKYIDNSGMEYTGAWVEDKQHGTGNLDLR